ncbi:MAG: DoxX family membrane protein [Candidatus Wildermuthbacteria bacterium]|nr:DoxX family membrane protein [Candidatus Wildermuthbacteria bacterium]
MERHASILLRVGLAFTFLYAALNSFMEPLNWIGYVPSFARDIVPDFMLLPAFSAYEVILGLWLLSGRKLFYSALLSALSLLGITVFNIPVFSVVFRDVGLLFAALALALLAKSSLDKGAKEGV